MAFTNATSKNKNKKKKNNIKNNKNKKKSLKFFYYHLFFTLAIFLGASNLSPAILLCANNRFFMSIFFS